MTVSDYGALATKNNTPSSQRARLTTARPRCGPLVLGIDARVAAFVPAVAAPERLDLPERRLALFGGRIRRCAYISMHCELMERTPAPSAADITTYGTLTSHLGKTLRLLGLKRVAKDVTPTLSDYLSARRPDAAE
jgi:hypothetical protein